MTLKTRIEKLITKTGIDRCECEGQPLKTVVVYPGDAMPSSFLRCSQFGRDLIYLIEIVYGRPDPPAWFTDELGGVDAGTATQKWLEHIESQMLGTNAAASPIGGDFSVVAGRILPDGPTISNVEGA